MMMASPCILSPIVVIAKSAKRSFPPAAKLRPSSPHCAKYSGAGVRRCLNAKFTDEIGGAKPHLTSCSFRPFRFTRKRYAASVRRQNRQKLRSCCALAERCGKKHRYLLDSQNRTPG